MEKISFKLQIFEGPLDALLFLIAKHKLNIQDIPISELLEQFLSMIDDMKNADLEIATEFLEMAARLVYMKSVSLLPKHEEAEELKRELTGQLIEYKTCKEMAGLLAQMRGMHDRFIRLPAPVEINSTYKRFHIPDELFSAYHDLMERMERRLPPPASTFAPIVSRRIVSVVSKIVFLLRALYTTGQASFDELFAAQNDRSELVATFLAMLELVKAGRLSVSQDNKTLFLNKSK